MPDFDYLKFIRVYGSQEDSEECFQGLGASAVYGGTEPGASGSDGSDGGDGSDGSDGGDDSTDIEALPEPFWTGQNAMIAAEIKYLQQLQEDFKRRKQDAETHKDNILEFFETWIEEGLGALIGGWVTANTGGAGVALGPLTNALTQMGIGKLFDELELWLTEGNAMFDGIIAEDTAIQDIEMSVPNYEHRQGLLSIHAQQISTILEQINTAEAGLQQNTVMQSGGDLSELFKQAFLTPQLDKEGAEVVDEDGNPEYQGFMNQRLKDLAYNEEILEEPGTGVRVVLRGKSRAIEY